MLRNRKAVRLPMNKALKGGTMVVSAKAALAALGAIVAVQLPLAASAADEFPFQLTWSGGSGLYIQCVGPWYRTSGCVRIGPAALDHQEFYRAEDTLFSAIGRWGCTIHGNDQCLAGKASAVFCGPGGNGKSSTVELAYDGGGTLTVNQSRTCGATLASSTLGQNGEADDTPAQDVDTYSFEGKPGEKVEIVLDRDGSSGSAGDTATLRVRAANGASLGQRTGTVPLSLDVTLRGTIEVAVSIQPGNGEPLRGSYVLEIISKSGDIGERKLRPTNNVEG